MNPNDDNTIRQYFIDAYESDGGLCFCNTCAESQEFHVLNTPDEEDPWRCAECGSLDVEFTDSGCMGNSNDYWCHKCEEHTKQVLESELMQTVEKWWSGLDFKTMEHLTGNRQVDFDPADGFQAFVDACRWWFDGKTNEEKIFIWHELSHDID